MITATTAWKQAVMRDGARLRVLVRFTDGTTTWSAVSGSMDSGSDLYRTMVAVQGVAPYDGKLDPLTHNFEIGEMFVDYDADWIRDILINNRLKGMQLDIWIGAAELSFADFTSYARSHTIESTIPRADGNTTTLISRGQLQMVSEALLNNGFWINKHLLTCLYSADGDGVLERAGGHSFNATSFDPTDSDYADIKHTLGGRADARYGWGGSNVVVSASGVGEEAQAGDLIENILRDLNADLVENEDGELEVKRFIVGSTAVDHWEESDIIPGSFEQDELETNIYNKIGAWCGVNKNGNTQSSYVADETVSQSTYAYPGESERIIPEAWRTYWTASTPMYIDADELPGTTNPTTMTLTGAGIHSLSGNKSGLTVDSSHPIYLMVLDANGSAREIVKATGLTRSTTHEGAIHGVNADGDQEQSDTFVFTATATNVTRGVFGTTNQGHGISRVYDITLLVITIDQYLARFAFGMPRIKLKTARDKWLVQVGDLVTLDSSQYVSYGKDGLSDTTKWQIVGKTYNPLGDDQVIEWDLALAYESSITRTADVSAVRPKLLEGLRDTEEQAVQWFIVSGLTVSTVSGLNLQVEAGSVSNGIDTIVISEPVTHTFKASSDTYVYIDKSQDRFFSGISFEDTTLGAGAPDTGSSRIFVRKVVTDGTGLDTQDATDAKTEPINGVNIVDSTVDTLQVAPSAISADQLRVMSLGGFLNNNARFGMRSKG